MKSVISLTLMAWWVGSATLLTAQEADPAAGPLGRSVAREAIRLAAEASVSNSAQAATSSDWSHVRKLEPGTEITVTVRGSQAGRRYFVSASESELTVLRVADLPARVTRVLREVASRHPEYLIGASQGGFIDREVRVAPDGVFVADQKVSDLGQIIGRVARPDVIEITAKGLDREKWVKRHPAKMGALIGLGLGFAIAAAKVQDPPTCRLECYQQVVMLGLGGIGAGLGALVGASVGAAINPTVGAPGVVYSVP
jgi:hypothetical protein